MPNPEALLVLRGVSKRYHAAGENLEVLRNVNLQVSPGESLAVVGPSGCGKSTLLNLMGALDRPSGGQILFAGQDLAGLSETDLARLRNRHVGLVFQFHHLLPQLTVLENVLVPALPSGRSDEAAARAADLLARVGLGQRLRHRPGRLSGGECQRVALVRALINRPDLLLADEPTGSLDHAAASALADLLAELNTADGLTVVVATHSMELARRMRQTYALQDGVLHATGPSEARP